MSSSSRRQRDSAEEATRRGHGLHPQRCARPRRVVPSSTAMMPVALASRSPVAGLLLLHVPFSDGSKLSICAAPEEHHNASSYYSSLATTPTSAWTHRIHLGCLPAPVKICGCCSSVRACCVRFTVLCDSVYDAVRLFSSSGVVHFWRGCSLLCAFGAFPFSSMQFIGTRRAVQQHGRGVHRRWTSPRDRNAFCLLF